MKTMATKATEAVFQLDQSLELDDDTNCIEEEEEKSPEDEQSNCWAELGRIEALIQQIRSWQHPNVLME